MADILTSDEIDSIRESVAPAAGDDLVSMIEVWRKPAYDDGDVAGGAGQNAYGFPVSTSTVANRPDQRRSMTQKLPGRITHGATGTEPTFGGQTVAMAPWTITFNWADNPNIIGEDQLRVAVDDWAPGTAYAEGDVVQPAESNGLFYTCEMAGTSGTSEPAWPTSEPGQTIEDGTARWAHSGQLRTFEVKDPGGEQTYKVVRMVRCEELTE